jgi:hypothetical protein
MRAALPNSTSRLSNIRYGHGRALSLVPFLRDPLPQFIAGSDVPTPAMPVPNWPALDSCNPEPSSTCVL